MRVVIAGGSGLIGRALSTAPLAAQRNEVVVLSRDPALRVATPPGARVEGLGRTHRGGLGRALDSSTVIINTRRRAGR